MRPSVVGDVGGYQLVRMLGSGTMGQVFLGHDPVLERPVAIKFLANLEADEVERQRFLVEARAIARVQHPNVVSIYAWGEVGGRPYIVYEFVRGTSLDRLGGKVPPNEIGRLALGVARGLAAVHRQGILHRDVKPANAMVAFDGDVKLIDFGLAKLLDRPAGREPTPPLGVATIAAVAVAAAPSPPPVAPTAPAAMAGPSELEQTAPPPASLRRASPVEALPAALTETLPPARRTPGPARSGPTPTPDDPTVGAPGPRSSLRPRSDDVGATQDLPGTQATVAGARGATALPPGQGELVSTGGDWGGTPAYMGPELWLREPATTRSDVYSYGALLYHLCAGQPPFPESERGALELAVLNRRPRPLAELAPGVDRRLAEVVDRCLARDPEARFAGGRELLEALEQIAGDTARYRPPEGNPYRGLHAFEAEHRGVFFGRRGDARDLIERLRERPAVVVAGPSGVGKSSLCRAGVLPQVEALGLGEGRSWSTVVMSPGRQPFSALVAALAPLANEEEEFLARRLRGELGPVGRELRRQLGNRGLLLFIDQLEEVVTDAPPEEAEPFWGVLAALWERLLGVRVLTTVRGDFLTRVAAASGFGDRLVQSVKVLATLDQEGLRQAVVGPAEAHGFRFEPPAMVERLVGAARDAEGGLPLLQFALAQLWEAREPSSHTIPESALDRIGGVHGALARHADEVIDGLPERSRAACRRLFLGLLTAAGTRARRSERELVDQSQEARVALAALVNGRLVVAESDDAGSAYQLAHEALLTEWPRLAEWRRDDAALRRQRERVVAQTEEWERLGRADEALWAARMLDEVQSLPPDFLGDRERAFLEASRAAGRRRRWRRIAVGAAAPLLLGGALLGFRLKARLDLDARVREQQGHAERALQVAQGLRAGWQTQRRRALGQFDARAPEAEATWSEVEALRRRTEGAFGEAAQALETALSLDPLRSTLRGRLGDLLLDRAVLAEECGRLEQRDELLRRLPLYDDDLSRRRRWEAPATLTLRPDVEAQASLARYAQSDDGPRVERVERRLGRTPVEATIAPGSYVVLLEAPDRAPVRVPVLLERGERLELAVPLPAAAGVPSGFVYVPAGRFLYGSDGSRGAPREFLRTEPLHPVTTGPFFIQRTETTLGEWLTFLRALPPPERQRHTPRLRTGGFHGAVELRLAADGRYQLTIQPGTRAYTAAEGEPIRYAGRHRRTVQDWRRWPVSGIPFASVKAYLAWLDETGRAKGARLCTEHEWERAARGADDREYPHGDRLAEDDANFDATYAQSPLGFGPDEVGSHPASRSPFGIDDMSGNVWEWVEPTNGAHFGRGGSYYFDRNAARVTNREPIQPDMGDLTMGLRVCATAK